jgi:hypothetical protein
MVPTVQIVDAQHRPLLEAWPLSWAPPLITDPVDIYATQTNLHPKLDLATDYRIHLPQDRPLTGAVIVEGGRNIVLIGGEITPTSAGERGLYVKGSTAQTQPRVVHVEGVKINGCQNADGIDLDAQGERGLIVQQQNVRVGDPANPVAGNFSGWHADCLQTWNGPAILRIDRLTGYTGYQGLMLGPAQFGGWRPSELGPWDFRRINLVGVDGFTDKAAYPIYADTLPADLEVRCEDVWAAPTGTHGAIYRPGRLDVNVGTPPDGDFVPAGAAGRSYVSPGYLVST